MGDDSLDVTDDVSDSVEDDALGVTGDDVVEADGPVLPATVFGSRHIKATANMLASSW